MKSVGVSIGVAQFFATTVDESRVWFTGQPVRGSMGMGIASAVLVIETPIITAGGEAAI